MNGSSALTSVSIYLNQIINPYMNTTTHIVWFERLILVTQKVKIMVLDFDVRVGGVRLCVLEVQETQNIPFVHISLTTYSIYSKYFLLL